MDEDEIVTDELEQPNVPPEDDVTEEKLTKTEPKANSGEDGDKTAATKPDSGEANNTPETGKKMTYISYSPEEIAAGFEAPYVLSFKIGEGKISKAQLIEELVGIWDELKTKFKDNPNVVKNYRRWVCRTMNIADSAFDSSDTLKNEVSKFADNVNNVLGSDSFNVKIERKEPKNVDIDIAGEEEIPEGNNKSDAAVMW